MIELPADSITRISPVADSREMINWCNRSSWLVDIKFNLSGQNLTGVTPYLTLCDYDLAGLIDRSL